MPTLHIVTKNMAIQKQNFFLVIPPGFEELAATELQLRGFNEMPLVKIKGGLEFQCDMGQGLGLNRISHLGTRVLLRLQEFRCRDFPKLFNRVRDMKWSEYIRGDFTVEVSAHKSRLMNKKRIAETVSEAVEKSLKGAKAAGAKPTAKAATATEIFVRFADDVCHISLDTSGEPLFKRGYKTLEALAPLRENLAAGLFFALYEMAGRPSQWELVDPLCGSGTFLTEAALFSGAGPRRAYSFESWFKGDLPNQSKIEMGAMALYGFDRHPDAIKLVEENLRAAKVDIAKVEQKDFLKSAIALSAPADKVVRLGIANPPYGVRIQLPAPPAEFYQRLLGTFESLQCRTFGFIVPRNHQKHLPKPHERLNFSNGGIDVAFMVY